MWQRGPDPEAGGPRIPGAGVDDSAEMVAECPALHPGLPYQKRDAVTFQLEEKADVIFLMLCSTLDRREAGSRPWPATLTAQLKPGGQFILNSAGRAARERVHSSLGAAAFARRGAGLSQDLLLPYYQGSTLPFWSRAGFRVEYAVLFDRPTAQKTGDGLADWVRMFVKKPFEGLEPRPAG
ncbi:MAG: class I SAM-dependent methyltransferase [Flavonifractor plautii]